jgi:hypothetical protein
VNLWQPIHGIVDQDGRQKEGRKYPTGKQKLDGFQVGRAPDGPHWLLRGVERHDPVSEVQVPAPRVHLKQDPILPPVERTMRIEADVVERRKKRPSAGAGVAGVESGVVGEQEDSVAGALDPEHVWVDDGLMRGVELREAHDRERRAVADVDSAEVDAVVVVEGDGLVVKAIEEERHVAAVVIIMVPLAEGLPDGDVAPQPAQGAAAGDHGGRQAEKNIVERLLRYHP